MNLAKKYGLENWEQKFFMLIIPDLNDEAFILQMLALRIFLVLWRIDTIGWITSLYLSVIYAMHMLLLWGNPVYTAINIYFLKATFMSNWKNFKTKGMSSECFHWRFEKDMDCNINT